MVRCTFVGPGVWKDRCGKLWSATQNDNPDVLRERDFDSIDDRDDLQFMITYGEMLEQHIDVVPEVPGDKIHETPEVIPEIPEIIPDVQVEVQEEIPVIPEVQVEVQVAPEDKKATKAQQIKIGK